MLIAKLAGSDLGTAERQQRLKVAFKLFSTKRKQSLVRIASPVETTNHLMDVNIAAVHR